MGLGKSSVDGQSNDLGIDGVVLPLVLPDADLPNARRAQHARVVAPLDALIVHVPAFSAGFEGNASGRAVGAGSGDQLR